MKCKHVHTIVYPHGNTHLVERFIWQYVFLWFVLAGFLPLPEVFIILEVPVFIANDGFNVRAKCLEHWPWRTVATAREGSCRRVESCPGTRLPVPHFLACLHNGKLRALCARFAACLAWRYACISGFHGLSPMRG
jgi:hypothetical protein